MKREYELELMDNEDSFDQELADASFAFISMVNRYFGGIAAAWNFLRRELECLPADEVVRIVDAGAGACDIPVALALRARKLGRKLEFHCVEKSPAARRIAEQVIDRAGTDNVVLAGDDIFEYRPATPCQLAMASMFFHHLGDDAVVNLLGSMGQYVRGALFINDLRRSAAACAAARLLTCCTGHSGVRHDALLSVRRGFTSRELAALISRVPGVSADVAEARWFRVVACVRYDQ